MSLTPGTSFGGYGITARLGEGGMGEVYRATDSTLKRDVALKVLPDAFASDPERLARFEREAQLLAALNHPHIAAIHGVAQEAGVRALVLEFVPGETLADRIARGPVRLDEALSIARQIAEALESAHEQGIIHRDLKPANIKVTDEGTVKVLDFGLAKALDPAVGPGRQASATPEAQSPTITSPLMTQRGMILGTAAYMSPEQARGRDADRRSDVWAFGCVLYEMLTGARAFPGEDATDTIAAIVRAQPDWSALPREVPSQIRRLIMGCLEKDRRARVGDLAVARFLLAQPREPGDAAGDATSGVAASASQGGRRGWKTPAAIGAAVLAGASIAGATAWALRPVVEHPRTVRFELSEAAALPFSMTGDSGMAIAPDDSAIVYRSSDVNRGVLVYRRLDRLETRALTTAAFADARTPFFSPDGQWVGFAGQRVARGGLISSGIFKVSIDGGPPVAIVTSPQLPRGAAWLDDGTIVFATNDPRTGLLAVPSAGGEATTLTTPDTARQEVDHTFPSALPGGTALLFTILSEGSTSSIAVLDRASGAITVLLRDGSEAQYVNSGHLVYRAGNTLMAVRFDLSRREVVGTPVPVVNEIASAVNGVGYFAASRGGTLLYVTGSAQPDSQVERTLVWVSRDGREEPVGAPARHYELARLSPDGTRLALQIRQGDADVWVWDLARKTINALSIESTFDGVPVWSSDGRRVFWGTTRPGDPRVYIVGRNADGTGTVETVSEHKEQTQFALSAHRDGSRLFGFRPGDQTIYAVRLGAGGGSTGAPVVEDLVTNMPLAWNPEISPDGRWLAYQSSKPGAHEIYVVPYPDVAGGLWQVTTTGAGRPGWSRDGRELFFVDAENRLNAVDVQASGDAFVFGAPRRVLDTVYFQPATPRNIPLRGYDPSPDGERFLVIKDTSTPAATTAPALTPPALTVPGLTVVLNWGTELRARLP